MEFYDTVIVEKARDLRMNGMPYRQIGLVLSVDPGTIRNWCKEISEKFLKVETRNELARQRIKVEEIRNLRTSRISRDDAKRLAAMLYWAEGTKYPNSSSVSFSNSDPKMVRFFIKLLRSAYSLDNSKFRVHLQIHSNQNKQKLFDFWSNILGIPVDSFWKPTITKATRKMKRSDYMGTCTLRYHDYRILLKLTATYEYISSGEVA